MLVFGNPHLLYRVSTNAALEVFDDGGLVLILPERRLVELNSSAVEVVQLLESGKNVDEAATALAAQYEISVGQALADVRELCEELTKSGVLEHR